MSNNMGLKLFPPPPSKKKPSRKVSVRRGPTVPAVQPQPIPEEEERAKSPEIHDGRQSAFSGRTSAMDGHISAMDSRYAPSAGQNSTSPLIDNGRSSAMDGRISAMDSHYAPPSAAAGPSNSNNPFIEMPRSHTSFSDAPTLVRSYSNASHSSIAKPKFSNGPSTSGEPAMIRSIFPRYNPEVPLEHQQYYPTQASPRHIPQNIISKAPYSPSYDSRTQHLRSPLSAPATVLSFAQNVQEIPRALEPSTTEELKELWKVTNGWRVSPSEGRSFTLKMNSAVDTPVHTLSSSTQVFYTMRLDPTSTSALLTLTRHDPTKSQRSPLLDRSSKSPIPGVEVLTTTLEESARRLPPNDGLVAILYPRAASNMALDLSSKPNADTLTIMAAAERECARLVWDEDSKTYYLVHPGMSSPFSIQIESSPAWSRVEYTLEHPQLPNNLVKLTRDGAGGGFLEVDTGAAAMVESFYIVDVAICAVLVVANAEEAKRNIERFEAPPVFDNETDSIRGKGKGKGRGDGRTKSLVGSLASPLGRKKDTPAVKIEEMEIDLESQSSLSDIKRKGGKKEKLPRSTRGVLGILFLIFRFVVWALTLLVNCVAKIIIGVSTCLTKA